MLINREQQRVIDEVEQNILLLASAGTGKTNTLAYRVAHLIVVAMRKRRISCV